MAKFVWKTEGSKSTVDVVHVPPIMTLLIIVSVTAAIAAVFTERLGNREQTQIEAKPKIRQEPMKESEQSATDEVKTQM